MNRIIFFLAILLATATSSFAAGTAAAMLQDTSFKFDVTLRGTTVNKGYVVLKNGSTDGIKFKNLTFFENHVALETKSGELMEISSDRILGIYELDTDAGAIYVVAGIVGLIGTVVGLAASNAELAGSGLGLFIGSLIWGKQYKLLYYAN